MHPVIKHILARKDKQVPVDDSRKIVLVLFGGSMSGVCGAGALLALQELGLADVFDEIYVASAGFPNASYLLSNKTPLGISIYYEEMVNNKFFNFFRPWKMVNIDYAISVVRKDARKKIDLDSILSKKTKVFVRVYNKNKKEHQYIEIHDAGHRNYFQLMRATCALPFLFPVPVILKGSRFRDGGFLERHVVDHYNYALDHSGATDVLAIFNNRSQLFEMHRNPQTVFEIYPEKGNEVGHFERDPERLRTAGEDMAKLVRKILNELDPIALF